MNKKSKNSNKIKISCKNCKKEFEVNYPSLKKSRKFCSHECYWENKKGPEIKKDCKVCYKKFYIKPSRKDDAKFCSKECFAKSRIGKKRSKEVRNAISDGHKGMKKPWIKGNFKIGQVPWNKLNLSEKRILEMYLIENIPGCNIAKKFGCSPPVIYDILKRNNIKLKGTRFFNKGRHPIAEFKSGDIRLIGKNNHSWIDGRSFEPYGEEFNIQLKNLIRKRDNQICMNCGIHREKLKEALTIHHINYDKKCNFPQNLVALCRECHALTNFNRGYWQKLFQGKLSKLYSYQYSEKGKIILKLK